MMGYFVARDIGPNRVYWTGKYGTGTSKIYTTDITKARMMRIENSALAHCDKGMNEKVVSRQFKD